MAAKKGSKMSWKWTWYLLPYFLSIIGGLIGYAVLRKKDEETAKSLLYLGVVILAVNLALLAWNLYAA